MGPPVWESVLVVPWPFCKQPIGRQCVDGRGVANNPRREYLSGGGWAGGWVFASGVLARAGGGISGDSSGKSVGPLPISGCPSWSVRWRTAREYLAGLVGRPDLAGMHGMPHAPGHGGRCAPPPRRAHRGCAELQSQHHVAQSAIALGMPSYELHKRSPCAIVPLHRWLRCRCRTCRSVCAIVSAPGALAPNGLPEAARPSAWEPSHNHVAEACRAALDAWAMWNQAQPGAWEFAAGDSDADAAVPCSLRPLSSSGGGATQESSPRATPHGLLGAAMRTSRAARCARMTW